MSYYTSIAMEICLYLVQVYVLTQISICCSELHLHRAEAHNSVTLHPGVAFVCHLELALMAGTNPIIWVWQHRRHHAYVDTEKDLFTPKQDGLWKVFFLTLWYYLRRWLPYKKLYEQFYAVQPKTQVHEFQDEFPFGVGGLLLLVCAFGPTRGLLLWFGHMLGYLLYWSSVTSFTHNGPGDPKPRIGCSVNVEVGLVLNFVTMGGLRWHEGHHEDEKQENFAWKSGGWDPMYSIIGMLEKCGLVTVHRHTAKEVRIG